MGIVQMPAHAQGQRFDTLQKVKGISGRQAGAEIAQALGTGADQKGSGAELFVEHQAVVTGIRLGQGRELA
jgi:L-serine deaminase